MSDLGHCIIAVLNQQPASRNGRRRVKVAGLKWSVRHNHSVSNSHDAPINGVTNWSRKDGFPKGYPGWYGRVWVRYAEPIDCFGSDPWQNTLTYPGTGGFGDYDGPFEAIYNAYLLEDPIKRRSRKGFPEPQIYSWDWRFFDEDWPDLQKCHLLDIVRDGAAASSNEFSWMDPEIEQADDEFLARVAKSK